MDKVWLVTGSASGLGIFLRWLPAAFGSVSDAPKSGLHYAPQYVLTESQISGLVRGASAHFSSPG